MSDGQYWAWLIVAGVIGLVSGLAWFLLRGNG